MELKKNLWLCWAAKNDSQTHNMSLMIKLDKNNMRKKSESILFMFVITNILSDKKIHDGKFYHRKARFS